jgi:uncharacterized protein YjbJ (UPF0337 family)
MTLKDKLSGKSKQVRGKGNEVAGAVKGDTGQEVKGKFQKLVGKIQDKLGNHNRDEPV